MKTITIVSSVSIAEPVVYNRLNPFFTQLNANNFKVFFICPKNEKNIEKIPKYVDLIEVDIDSLKPKSFIKRAIYEFKDVRRLLKLAKAIQSEKYILTMPSMFLSFLAPIYLKKENVFLDIRDLTWEYLSNKNFIQILSKKIFSFWFKNSVSFFKAISVTNESEFEYIKKIYKKEIFLVTNGIGKTQYEKLIKVKKSSNKDFSTIVYIGNVGLAQNLETLIYVAKQLPKNKFIIVGTGIDFERIKKLVNELNLKNVTLTGRVDWEDVYNYYNEADILYAQLTPEYSIAMPSKLYEYLSTGKYIIYGGEKQAVDKLSEFSNYKNISSNNEEELKNAILEFDNKIIYKEINLENRKIIKDKYIREDAIDNFIKYLNNI
ncbi:glycosyltransferase [Aliarcobacter skirrowii]|uniref:glycosyltransferase n=1 Tax=Aliarcobacter skirrowii TaxID=28200 RepID=UPI0029ABBBBB|nr:glycosyltransferase [Aliarcobacter skirrowii]MDX4050879.1 glycosyltransferase [Aliarcobacter skirrowii]